MTWQRNCNHCGYLIIYNRKEHLTRALKCNSKCVKCRTLGKCNPFYGKQHSKETKEKYSDQRSGVKNVMYGKVSAFRGKKHSEQSILKQQERRREFWERKGHKDITGFEKYRWEVDRLTRKQPIHLLENYNKRGRAGVKGAYHLDHIFSVWNGFNKKLTCKEISDISNLRFITWEENQRKWYK